MFYNPAADWIARLKHLTQFAVNAILGAITVTVTPTGGSATNFTYVVVAKTGADQIPTLASITTGAATLTASAYNTIAWSPLAGTNLSLVTYDVWRTVGGVTQGLIASGLTGLSLVDNGLVATAGTAPVRNTTGTFVGAQQLPQTVVSAAGAGVLAPNAGSVIITAATPATVTLAAPVATTDDGAILKVTCTTAQAHTITTPANKINGNKYIATFAAIGDTITFEAYQGLWMVSANTTTLS